MGGIFKMKTQSKEYIEKQKVRDAIKEVWKHEPFGHVIRDELLNKLGL